MAWRIWRNFFNFMFGSPPPPGKIKSRRLCLRALPADQRRKSNSINVMYHMVFVRTLAGYFLYQNEVGVPVTDEIGVIS